MKIKFFKLPHTIVAEGTNIDANVYYMNHVRRIFRFIGTNIIDFGFTVTPQLVVAFSVTHSLILSFLYMLYTNDSFNTKLEALCVAAGICQGIHKLYVVLLYPDDCTVVFEKIRQLHLEYSDHPELAPLLKKVCVYCTIIVELLTVGFFCVITCYLLLPIILWKKYGLFTTIFPIQYPFIDWHTVVGYAINTASHAYCASIGLIAILASDAVFLYVILHSIGYRKIFEFRISKLEKLLFEPAPQNRTKIQEQLHVCIRAHQDYMKYIVLIDSVYRGVCMSQLITSEILLSVSLILSLWAHYIVGPFLATIGLFQLLEYCILGTVVTVQNEYVGDTIYGLSWYLLPVKYQKLISFMILRAQKSPEITAGSFAHLNVETCMSILKTTYSFVMMVLKFLS